MSTRLDAARMRLLNEALYALYDDLAEPLSYRRVVDSLTRLVPAISFSAVKIESRPKRFVTVAQHNWDQTFSAKIARVGHQHPVVVEMKRSGFHPVLRLSDLCTIREFKRTEVYNEVYRFLSGFRDHAGLMTRLPGCQVGFAFNSDRTIPNEDVLLLELLHPHLERILRRATQYLNLRSRQPLTPREREVLHWLAEGKRDAEIALILRMASRTVEQHVRVILRKLEVETRTAAAAISWRARAGVPGPDPEQLPFQPSRD